MMKITFLKEIKYHRVFGNSEYEIQMMNCLNLVLEN